MNLATLLILLIIVIGVIAAGVILSSSRDAKTEPQNVDAQSLTQSDDSGQLSANHHNDLNTKSGQSSKQGQTQAGETPEKTRTIIQSRDVIKNIRNIMINHVKNYDSSDSLSAEELRIITNYEETFDVDLENLGLNTDDDSIDFKKSLKFIMRLLKAFAKAEINNLQFMKNFMAKIVAEIDVQVGLENPNGAEILKNIPVMIDILKSFLIYEYIVLTDDSGNSEVKANSINNLIITLTSKAEIVDTNYKDNYMYYNAALLLSNYLFSFRYFNDMVENLSTWKQQYKDSFAKCKTSGSDAFKFYSSTYKLLNVIDEN